ncbi:hypothetical protein CXU12_11905 [Akkermansia muciniphila]|nr:hypothetical protein CXU12_11905 [Akkermansia muciniphila]
MVPCSAERRGLAERRRRENKSLRSRLDAFHSNRGDLCKGTTPAGMRLGKKQANEQVPENRTIPGHKKAARRRPFLL